MIVGTLPPPRFTTGELKPDDVNFCYGSRDGQLWPILNAIFNLNLKFENTKAAIEHRKRFLTEQRIGICDIVDRAFREKIDASDLGMKDAQLRDLISIVHGHPHIQTLLFMGGNSKNGPEYFFRKLLKEYGLTLDVISSEVPRIHSVVLPDSDRKLRTVSLTAPSGSANRAVGSLDAYKLRKAKNPDYNTMDFRIEQYRPFFME